jgi:translation elongation factor EF-Tu-like GTPase
MMRVMVVEGVYRFKGTQLVGRLECDVRVNDTVFIVPHAAKIYAIENYKKLRESALAGEGIAHVSEHPRCSG